MSVQRISVGSVVLGFNAAIQAIAGSYAVGDVILVFHAEHLGADTISTPAGWTDVGDATNTGQSRVFGIVAASNNVAMPSIQFGSDRSFCYAVAYRGVTLSAAFAALGRATNTLQNIAGPSSSKTPSANGALVLFFGNRNKTATANGNTFSAPVFAGSGLSVIQQHAQNGTTTSSVLCEWIQGTATAIPANLSAPGAIAESTNQSQQGVLIGLLAAVAPGPQYTSDPAVSTLAATSASFTQTLDSDCTAYAVAVAHGSGTPSSTQIKAGQNSSGSAAVAAVNGAATATVQKSLSLSVLVASTAYDFFFVGNNANGDTTVKSVLNQTTPAASTITASVTSANTDGYTIGYTPGATGTVYLVALVKGSATPTPAQVRTGSPTGFISRFSKAATNGVGDSLSATALTLPKADLHIILNTGGTNDSAVTSFLNQLKAPSAGRQYCSFGTLSGSSPFQGVSPTVAAGDVLDIVATTPSGYAVTPSSSGDLIIDAGGDESRELPAFNVYDDSAGAMYYTADSLVSINDLAPVPTGTSDAFTYFLPKNSAITPVDLTPLATDPENDVVTYSENTALLTGLGLSITGGNTLSGTTPNANSITDVELLASDPYGGGLPLTGRLVIGQVTVPDVSAYNKDAVDFATQILQSAYLKQASNFQQSNQPYGTFLTQSPSAGATANPNSTVTMNFSGGAPGHVRDRYGFNLWIGFR